MPAAGLGGGDEEDEAGHDGGVRPVIAAQVPPATAEEGDGPHHERGAEDVPAGEGAGHDGEGDDEGFCHQDDHAGAVIAADIDHGDILGGGGHEDGGGGVAGEKTDNPGGGEGHGTARRAGNIHGEHGMLKDTGQPG